MPLTSLGCQRVAEWCFGGGTPPSSVFVGLAELAPLSGRTTMDSLQEIRSPGQDGYARREVVRGSSGWQLFNPGISPPVARMVGNLPFQNMSASPWPAIEVVFVATTATGGELLWADVIDPVVVQPDQTFLLPGYDRAFFFVDRDGLAPTFLDPQRQSAVVWRTTERQTDPPPAASGVVNHDYCARPSGAAFAEALLKLEKMIYSVVGTADPNNPPIHEPPPGDGWKELPNPRILWPNVFRERKSEFFGGPDFWDAYDYLARGEYAGGAAVPLKPRSPDPLRQKQELAHPPQISNVYRDYSEHPFDPPANVVVGVEADFDPTGRIGNPKLVYQAAPGGSAEIIMTPVSGNRWRAEIPGLAHDAQVTWTLKATYSGLAPVPLTVVDPMGAAYSYRAFTHDNLYGSGFPEQYTNRDTDHWDFEAGFPIQAHHINLARWALNWIGSMFEHDPRTRPDASCCMSMPIKFYWSGANRPGWYITGGRPNQITSRDPGGTPPPSTLGARTRWRGDPRYKYWPDSFLVTYPFNVYFGGNESWEALPQFLDTVPKPVGMSAEAWFVHPLYGTVIPDMRSRGLQHCDVVDAEHVQEIIAAVNWLESNGLWQLRGIPTAARTVTSFAGEPCGRWWYEFECGPEGPNCVGYDYYEGEYLPGQCDRYDFDDGPCDDCYARDAANNPIPYPQPTPAQCATGLPYPGACLLRWRFRSQGWNDVAGGSHWYARWGESTCGARGQFWDAFAAGAGFNCCETDGNLLDPPAPYEHHYAYGTYPLGESPGGSDVVGFAAWACGPPRCDPGGVDSNHGNGYQDWSNIYNPQGIQGQFGNCFEQLYYCGEDLGTPGFDAVQAVLVTIGQSWKDFDPGICPGSSVRPNVPSGFDPDEVCSETHGESTAQCNAQFYWVGCIVEPEFDCRGLVWVRVKHDGLSPY